MKIKLRNRPKHLVNLNGQLICFFGFHMIVSTLHVILDEPKHANHGASHIVFSSRGGASVQKVKNMVFIESTSANNHTSDFYLLSRSKSMKLLLLTILEKEKNCEISSSTLHAFRLNPSGHYTKCAHTLFRFSLVNKK